MDDPRRLMKKAKLTLNVDEEVVQKAKDLNINISEVTEMALRGYTTTKGKSESDAGDIRSAYDFLFRSMMPTLMRFDATVEVGARHSSAGDEESTLYLLPEGKLYWWDNLSDEALDTTLDKVPLWTLHNPGKIVSNWLAKLKKAKEEAPERIKAIQLYSGIVEVMSKTLTGTSSPSDHHPSSPTDSESGKGRRSRKRQTINTGRVRAKA